VLVTGTLLRTARYEWWRLMTLRSTFAIAGVALAVSSVVSLLIATAAVEGNVGGPGQIWVALLSQGAALSMPFITGYVIALVGVYGWAEEVTGDAIATTFTTLPGRTVVTVGRFTTVALASAALASACCVAVTVVGGFRVGWDWTVITSNQAIEQCLRTVAYSVSLALLAGALCVLFRSHTVAVFTILLVPWLVEPVITAIVFILPGLQEHTGLLRFLPFAAAADVLTDPTLGSYVGPPRLEFPTAVVELIAIVTVMVTLAGIAFVRRDPLARH